MGPGSGEAVIMKHLVILELETGFEAIPLPRGEGNKRVSSDGLVGQISRGETT